MRSTSRGRIVTWKADKAYGFIRAEDGGKVRAADVSIQGLERRIAKARPSVELEPRPVHLMLALACLVAIGWLVVYRDLPIAVLAVFLVSSLIAFLMYAFDKAAAMNRRWRTKESTLLLVGLLGGWPGALVAQGMFRHKSSKIEFQVAFWFTVIANGAVVAWWCFFRVG